jgi:hypothetical protein
MRIGELAFRTLAMAVVVTAIEARPAAADEKWRSCTPTDVTAYRGRVHVRCSSAVDGFEFFAVPAADAELTNKLVSLASTALVYGKKVSVLFDPDDDSGPQFGCKKNDCRPLRAIGLLK